MDSQMEDAPRVCCLTSLATELILQIIEYIPCASHLDFACTSQHFLACSSDVLARHETAFLKYKVTSDLDPITVPSLLRSAFGYSDPIPAWHVRSLEIWNDGYTPVRGQTPASKTNTNTEGSIVPRTWDSHYGPVEEYVQQVNCCDDTGDLCESVRDQIYEGFPGFLTATLIANCPRLIDVKFVKTSRDYVGDSKACLFWLRVLMKGTISQATVCKPGFSSLTHVAVGVESTQANTMASPYIEPSANIDLLIQLLRLPCIESIYIKDFVSQQDDEMDDYSHLLPENCSSIKHLFFDNCDTLGQTFCIALLEAPKELISVAFRAGEGDLHDVDSIVSGLGGTGERTIESLMFYGYQRGQTHGYRCSAYRPEELNEFDVLKNICINFRDVELDAVYTLDGDKLDYETDGAYLERFFVNAFPPTMETLTFWGEAGDVFVAWEPSIRTGVEDALIWLINSSEHIYPDLKAIYLEAVERSRDGPKKKTLWFQRLVEVARKRGIDVYTLTNRGEKRHEISFPEGLDSYDLVTGPDYPRPSDWMFDVYTGRRVPPGCGKCGECENCLAQYTKELWAKVKTWETPVPEE